MRRLLWIASAAAACCFAADAARAAELQAPQNAVAGTAVSIPSSGSGEATLYLVGPGGVVKRKVSLGQTIELKAEEVRVAGRYTALLSFGSKVDFFVAPAKPAQLAFLARPSRVPVAKPGVITGVAFVFDAFKNLVLEPAPVKFDLSVQGTNASQTVNSKDGIAWTRMDSASKEGAAQFVASAGDVKVNRVVQQTAGEPCNIRMKVAGKTERSIIVETDPIRDCSGNAVPDGTIVTFSLLDSKGGRTTVDSRIKKGIARAELPAGDSGTVSVAAGVVSGNELRVGGGQ
ncbi:MAG: hypothetical protein HYX28_09850 [Candidatus Koribacter versatilis]|uniref:DUF5666 domain-containing protein n=1 Tax=Candidatus Korobacter versatilis TaxID=658062 RepID=A0A932A9H4_9BACT|nr:hypothetical protein [Candidatus Koribacter versatilis]